MPPLRYEEVYRLKQEFPHLFIEINGGFRELETIQAQLSKVDAVMMGRAAYETPYLFATVDRDLFREEVGPATRREVVEGMLSYIEDQLAKGVYLNRMTRHMLGLFAHKEGARAWRRFISENAHKKGSGGEVLRGAMASVPDYVLDERPQRAADRSREVVAQ